MESKTLYATGSFFTLSSQFSLLRSVMLETLDNG